MSDATDLFERTLKNHGQSITQPRLTVFEALQGQEPLTMHELVSRCTDMDRASVYRAVTVFEKLGIIQRLQIGWKYKLELSDDFHHHHHHLTCSRCGKTIPFEEDAHLEQHLHDFAAQHGFSMKAHQLEISGLCHDCAPRAVTD